MAKKLSKSRKRVPRRAAKKSWIENLFTFPVLFIVAVAAMSMFTLYYISRPAADVKGATTADYVIYTQEQVDALPKNTNTAGYDYPKYIRTLLWRDSNGNATMDNYESCPNKSYSFNVNGVRKTKTQNSNCEYAYIKVSKNCNTVRFVNTLANYVYTGMRYSDGNDSYKKTTSKEVTLCGVSGYGEGYGYSEVEFGIKQK
jgi:hypothetical protein